MKNRNFIIDGKTYRIIDGLLVDELQVKEANGRFSHVSYVRNMADALNVIRNEPRTQLEGI